MGGTPPANRRYANRHEAGLHPTYTQYNVILMRFKTAKGERYGRCKRNNDGGSYIRDCLDDRKCS